jgi:hypothetical protein
VSRLRSGWKELSFEKKLSVIVVPILVALIGVVVPILVRDSGAKDKGTTVNVPSATTWPEDRDEGESGIPESASGVGGVVSRVLEAPDPGVAYRELDPQDKRMFDERMLPTSYTEDPPKIVETQADGDPCFDATSEITALASSGDPVYSFTVAGYWCTEDGVIPPTEKQARVLEVRLHVGGWRLRERDVGSSVSENGSIVYLRGTYTFELPGIVPDQTEKRYIIGTPTGSACVGVSTIC